MIVVDTTVLVYAVGKAHPLRDPCRRFIPTVYRRCGGRPGERDDDGRSNQEFVHVRARRTTRSEASSLGADYVQLLSPLPATVEAELMSGLQLFAGVDGLGAFDAVLAAIALSRGADAMVSADAAFARVPGMRHIHPAAAEADLLLS